MSELDIIQNALTQEGFTEIEANIFSNLTQMCGVEVTEWGDVKRMYIDIYNSPVLSKAEPMKIHRVPAKKTCPFCHTAGGESIYHKGTCANCGGVL